jgi:3-oxoacyl-[acyl-carrier protein] reductase
LADRQLPGWTNDRYENSFHTDATCRENPPFGAVTAASMRSRTAPKCQPCPKIPLGRLGQPDEYATVALFLAAEDHYLVGQVIRSNGGWVI